MINKMNQPWYKTITNKSLIKRASVYAVVVGALLVSINHGNAILDNALNYTRVVQIILTIMVPFLVSITSSYLTIMKMGNVISGHSTRIYSLENQLNLLSKFPDQNPNPVFRISMRGELLYANPASNFILKALQTNIGEKIPDYLFREIAEVKSEDTGTIEFKLDGRIFSLLVVFIHEFDFINIYATDITAMKVINKFPDQNPNPVLRVSKDGALLYANSTSDLILNELRIKVGDKVQDEFKKEIDKLIANNSGGTLELRASEKTFELLIVPVYEFDFINIYGTDITARKVINKFPDQNPNPVLRISKEGELLYANSTSDLILDELGIKVGQKVPGWLKTNMDKILDSKSGEKMEVTAAHRTFELLVVSVYEYGFINIYATDITARKVINKFPDQNPNPVLRVSKEGALLYANSTSNLILNELGIKVGDKIPHRFKRNINEILESDAGGTMELQTADRIYELLVVYVYEYDFINIYATDITDKIELKKAHAENEKLLLNILPQSIADRLKMGEEVIADKFGEISVLFADVVGFTHLTTKLLPSQLVNLLNEIFTIFDKLTEKYNLEKIKTVGDAYMAVGGLNTEAGHLEEIAMMALEMNQQIENFNSKSKFAISIRTGIHKGSAVAGVIGIKKFVYDVWGDTVNIASRMESHSLPGKIQASESVYKTLKDKFDFEPRGKIEIKGKQPMDTYFLISKL